MKKSLLLLAVIMLCGALFCACGDEVPQVDISSVVEVKSADGVNYAYAEVESAAAKDPTQINTWYTDYYKDLRDSGEISALVVRYSDDPDHATLFTGINVYTGCPIDNKDNAAFKQHEKWYHTESDRDRVLIEVEE